MLRWGTPVMHFRRTAQRDTEIRGQRIAEGDKVVIWYISANRDEDVFDDPYRFDIARTPERARGLRRRRPALLPRRQPGPAGDPGDVRGAAPALPDMELAGPVQRLRSNFINGIKHMPVRFTKTRRELAARTVAMS